MVDFLVIGPEFSLAYKNIFPLIKDGDISFGWNRVVEFENGVKFGNIRWFSNISDYCIPPLEFKRQYKDSDYKKFDNYDAIYIKKSEDIPVDYDGLMGVPITFIDKWNPGQFDNLDIINIDRIEDIPSDYQDIMGVPLSFLDRWNKDQFEMVGLLTDNKGDGIYIFNGTETYTDERHKKSKCGVIDGKRIYSRLLIKKKIS